MTSFAKHHSSASSPCCNTINANPMSRLLRALVALFFLAGTSLSFQDSGVSAGAATALGFLAGLITWVSFGLARFVRRLVTAPRDHWRLSPWKSFVLFGIEPAFFAVIAGSMAMAALAQLAGIELPESAAGSGH